MFVSIHHQIHDDQLWKQKVNAMAPPPEPASTQTYVQVHEERATGLPTSELS